MNRKHLIYIFLIGILLAACEPTEIDKIDLGEAPVTDQLDFTIEPGDDDFHFVVTNKSSVTGIANWDLGNGSKATAQQITVYYPLAGEYTITLSLYTSGGSASISKQLEQEKTDFSIFDDPKFTFISGGADDLDGKTWVVDSTSKAHYGVGEPGGTGTEYWTANPLDKTGTGAYDDELTFLLKDFVLNYENHGNSFVKSFQKDNSHYSNPVDVGGDFKVDYNPKPGTWFIQNVDGVDYLTMNGPTPLFPTFDTGGDRMYEIVELSENKMVLTTIGGDENLWYYILIPKGYTPPSITYTFNQNEGTDNLFTFSLTDVQIPEGEDITEVSWNFGDGTDAYKTTNYQEQVTHTYIKKGAYNLTVTISSSLGDIVDVQSINVTNNHSTYTEYLLDEMVMYTDFGETTLTPMLADKADGKASIEVVDNPDNSMYPNRSLHCAYFMKENAQWANAYLELPSGYRFDLELRHTFKIMVYGVAGQEVLFKLENTDLGGDAWQTGTHDFKYTIKETNKWEIATFDLSGIGAGSDETGKITTDDVTTDTRFNSGYYNVARFMLQPGNNEGTFSFYLDAFAGPHVKGLK